MKHLPLYILELCCIVIPLGASAYLLSFSPLYIIKAIALLLLINWLGWLQNRPGNMPYDYTFLIRRGLIFFVLSLLFVHVLPLTAKLLTVFIIFFSGLHLSQAEDLFYLSPPKKRAHSQRIEQLLTAGIIFLITFIMTFFFSNHLIDKQALIKIYTGFNNTALILIFSFILLVLLSILHITQMRHSPPRPIAVSAIIVGEILIFLLGGCIVPPFYIALVYHKNKFLIFRLSVYLMIASLLAGENSSIFYFLPTMASIAFYFYHIRCNRFFYNENRQHFI